MPVKAPRICGCGYRVAGGERCLCEQRRKAEADKRRQGARERGYDSKWDRERTAFLKLHPRCARPGCGADSAVVDHIVPHKGDMRLFWDRSNWQPLCTGCHSRWKQSQERRGTTPRREG